MAGTWGWVQGMGYYTALYCSLQEVLGILSRAPRAVAKRRRESGTKEGFWVLAQHLHKQGRGKLSLNSRK